MQIQSFVYKRCNLVLVCNATETGLDVPSSINMADDDVITV